ncbi:hypothetical protein Trydic_g4482 [Trypoxylus dichotomus]
MKFCVKLERTASETLQMIRTAYGDAAFSSAHVFRWYKVFRDNETIEDGHRFGRSSTSKIDESVTKVCSVLARDRLLILSMIAHEVTVRLLFIEW